MYKISFNLFRSVARSISHSPIIFGLWDGMYKFNYTHKRYLHYKHKKTYVHLSFQLTTFQCAIPAKSSRASFGILYLRNNVQYLLQARKQAISYPEGTGGAGCQEEAVAAYRVGVGHRCSSRLWRSSLKRAILSIAFWPDGQSGEHAQRYVTWWWVRLHLVLDNCRIEVTYSTAIFCLRQRS